MKRLLTILGTAAILALAIAPPVTAQQILREDTASTVMIGPFVDSTDGVTPETALTISQADIRISKNGGAFAQTNNATGATHAENGWYSVPLDTTDTSTSGRLQVVVAEAGALQVFATFTVVEEQVYDAHYAASATGIDGTALRDAIVNSTAAEAIFESVDAIDIDAAGSFGFYLKTALPAAAPGANGGLPTVDANNRIAGIAGTLNTLDDLDTAQDAQHAATQSDVADVQATLDAQSGVSGVVTTGSTDTVVNVTSPAITGGEWEGAQLTFAPDTATVALRGQSREIIDTADGSPDTITVHRAFSTAPANGDTFLIYSGSGTAPDLFDPATDTVANVTTVATLTGHTPQTGDSFALIGATGSGLTSLATQASVNTVDGNVDTLITRIPDTLSLANVKTQVYDSLVDNDYATALFASLAGDHTTINSMGALLNGLKADLDLITGTDGVTLATAQGNYTPATAAALTTAQGDITSILADTNVLQTEWADGGRLDLILDDAASGGAGLTKSQVREALFEDAYDLAATASDGSAFGRILDADTDASFDWVQADDSLQGIAEGAAGGGLDAAGVRAAVGLAAANLDTQLAAIVADTGELQTDWADGGRLDLILDTAASGGAGLTQQQVRDALKLAPTAGAPAAGSIDAHLDDTLTAIADVPTTAEFNARTLASGDYFAPGSDTVANVTTVATLTGHTPQTGDTFGVLPANFAAMDISAGGDVSLGALLGTAVTETGAGDLAGGFTNWFDVATPTKTLNDAGVMGAGLSAEDVWTYGTRTLTAGGSGLDAAGVRDAIGLATANLDTQLGSIKTDTGTDLPADIAALPTDADVEAAALASLQSLHLQKLFAEDYNPASKPGAATAWANELVESDVGTTRFTANALEQGPAGGGATGGIAVEARTQTPIGPAYQVRLSRRADGTLAATSPVRIGSSATIQPAVGVDTTPVYGGVWVATVGTPVVSPADELIVTAAGPQSESIVVQLGGGHQADTEYTVDVPYTMQNGDADVATFTVEVGP